MNWGEKDSKNKWYLPKFPPKLLFLLSLVVLTLSIIASFNPLEFDPIFILFGLLSLIISSYLIWFQEKEDQKDSSDNSKKEKSFLEKLFKKKKQVYEIPKI